MNLYLDDNINKGRLADRLRKAGHQVVLPATVGLAGTTDTRHFLHALEHNLALITKDHDDFFVLHRIVRAAQGHHAGILAVRADNDPRRDMKDADVVRAIRNLEQSGAPIANEFNVLNHWR
jgi:predicted nuclease of predicted toxin-antitoxin system